MAAKPVKRAGGGLPKRWLETPRNTLCDAQGLYLRAWDGTPITEHQALPNMLQTDAATLELFAWLGVAESSRLGA